MDYDIGKAFAAIEEELIASMMRNMKKHREWETDEGFQWSMWQAEQLKALDKYKRANKKKFERQFNEINGSIRMLIEQARAEGGMEQELEILEAIEKGWKPPKMPQNHMDISGEFFKLNTRKLEALIKATENDFQRAETAMLRMANDQYRQVIFNAQVYANTGAGTYEKAVDMATKDFLSRGINCIEYSNGARHTMRDYAEMAIRTAAKRAYLTGEGEKRQEWGIDTVIVHKRGNPCPKCLPFVGKVLIDDVWSGGSSAEGQKYPLMSTAVSAGLYHPRCKDTHSTYFPGISEEPDDVFTKDEIAKVEEQYREEQRQNYIERQIERYERLENNALDEENKRNYAVKKAALKSVKGTVHGKSLKLQLNSYSDYMRAIENKLERQRKISYGWTYEEALRDFSSIDDFIDGTEKIEFLKLQKEVEELQNRLKRDVIDGKIYLDNCGQAFDFDTLGAHIKNKYKIDMDASVKSLDFESIKEGMQGIELVMDEFPQAQKSLVKISTDKSGVMCASYNGTINFNPSYYTDRTKAVNASQSTGGFHPKGSNVVSTGSHEMGHILEKALIDKDTGGGITGRRAWGDCTYAKAVVSEACKTAKKMTGKKYGELKGDISGYAKQDASECLAEAVADYITNGENASLLSKEIWKILKKELG